MKDVKAIVAKNLTSLRKINGLTQAELAEKLNYSDKAVSRWEHGETMPDINVLYELCEFYGITMNDLVNEEYTADAKENGKEKSENAYRMWLGIVTASTVWLFFYNFVYLHTYGARKCILAFLCLGNSCINSSFYVHMQEKFRLDCQVRPWLCCYLDTDKRGVFALVGRIWCQPVDDFLDWRALAGNVLYVAENEKI